jgi:hypothetical protein
MYILLGASTITAFLKELADSLVIFWVVIVNAIISLIQEAKSRTAIWSLGKSLKAVKSGIYYLAQEKTDQPIWKSVPEMQMLDNAKRPDTKFGVNGNLAAASLYDLIPGKFEANKPAGDWNQVQIMFYKGTVDY